MYGNWTKSSYKMKVCVIPYLEPLGLKCEMTVMLLDQVMGHDITFENSNCQFARSWIRFVMN